MYSPIVLLTPILGIHFKEIIGQAQKDVYMIHLLLQACSLYQRFGNK